VQNEWSAGLQIRVACIEAVDHDRVQVSHASAEYIALLHQPMVNPDDGQETYLEKTSPSTAFSILSQRFSNDYFFVTAVHDAAKCQFQDSEMRRMTVSAARPDDPTDRRPC